MDLVEKFRSEHINKNLNETLANIIIKMNELIERFNELESDMNDLHT